MLTLPKIRSALAPVTMREDQMPTDLAPGLDLASRRHRPVKQAVETGHAHAGFARLDVFEERRKPADELARLQRAGHVAKLLETDAGLAGAGAPRIVVNFLR